MADIPNAQNTDDCMDATATGNGTIEPPLLCDELCAITLTPLVELTGDNFIRLPCRHAFDKNALVAGFNIQRSHIYKCPVCRTVLQPSKMGLVLNRKSATQDFSEADVAEMERLSRETVALILEEENALALIEEGHTSDMEDESYHVEDEELEAASAESGFSDVVSESSGSQMSVDEEDARLDDSMNPIAGESQNEQMPLRNPQERGPTRTNASAWILDDGFDQKDNDDYIPSHSSESSSSMSDSEE